MPAPANGPLTLIGTILNPDGTGATGFLALQLNTYGSVQPNAGGPKAILPNDMMRVQFVNGVIQGTPMVYGNDNLAGATYYIAQFYQQGNPDPDFTQNWYISGPGPDFDLGTVQPIQSSNLPEYLSLSQILGTTGIITGLQGDVIANGFGDVFASLALVNSAPGSYAPAAITVDAKGRVLAASSLALSYSSFTGMVPTSALPIATTTSVGVVKVGSGLAVDGTGLLSTVSGSGATFTLTTTGTSGPATLNSGVLNVPEYSSGSAGGWTWGSNGLGSWRQDPNGNIEAWGNASLPATGNNQSTVNVTLPVTFGRTPLILVTLASRPRSAPDMPTVGTYGASDTGFTINAMCVVPEGGGGVTFDNAVTVNWYAFGPSV